MELETDRVLKLVFPEGLPPNLKDNPDLGEYLYKLGSYKVEQLNKEQTKLSEEKKAVVEQTQDLAITNYKTFIQTAECSREIFKEFKETETKLDCLIDKLPTFSRKCEEFSNASRDINTHRRLNSLTLTRNAQLLEILELPQLMDTCIRDGHFEEALELSAYVQRLGVKHGNIPIIKSIVSDMEASWQTMLRQLLSQLRTDLQLPRCLQVVGYLRRMEAFTEPELRLKFLQARDSWLTSLLSNIPNEDPNHHLSKTIEFSRIHLFNIVTQYKAIFNDDEQALNLGSKDQYINEPCIFYSWLQQKVTQFINTMKADLSRSVTSLDSLLGQCMYFGLSFSRVGADFRSLIAPVVTKTVNTNFNDNLHKVTKKFEQDMDSYILINKIHNITRQKTEDGINPPESLLDFYPLAEYCNGLLTIFNNLRLCAPFSVADVVTLNLENSLTIVAKLIVVYYKQEQTTFLNAEKDNFNKFCACFAYDLVPYIQKCIHIIFPPYQLANFLGINVMTLEKEKITYLNQTLILSHIKHLLPDKFDSALNTVTENIEKSESEENDNLKDDAEVVSEKVTDLDVGQGTLEIDTA